MDPGRTERFRPADPAASDARGRESAARVVVLAAAGGGHDLPPARATDEAAEAPKLQCIHVVSAYEAAAEILVAPTLALVADLRLVAGRHLRLLEIARQMAVEVLAVGAVPAGLTGEDLSGVRLSSRADLAAALARLAGEYEEPGEASPSPASLQAPAVEVNEFDAVASPGEAPPPHVPSDGEGELEAEIVEPVEPISPEQLRAEAMRNRRAAAQPPAPEPPAEPSRLLSPEELAALLEREP